MTRPILFGFVKRPKWTACSYVSAPTHFVTIPGDVSRRCQRHPGTHASYLFSCDLNRHVFVAADRREGTNHFTRASLSS
jgi:hypothetical protein